MLSKIIIFHSPLPDDAPADELDVLQQAAYFSDNLIQMGYEVEVMPFPYNIEQLKILLQATKPLLVVNLVETIMGDGRLVHVGPALLEHFKVSMTGCSAHALYLSSHKILAKQHMTAHKISTPGFYSFTSLQNAAEDAVKKPYIVKSLWEHASFGLDENKPLIFSTKNDLLNRFEQETVPGDFFCEEYIHGREFNLSIIDSDQGPQVLPQAEIRFEYPEGKPRILGYKAKWDEDSFEYKHTLRTFEFPPEDHPLLQELKNKALKCWHVFELRGYARVDFRVDDSGRIFVLEINANPCISPDSGFVAAAQKAGLSNMEVVKRITGL